MVATIQFVNALLTSMIYFSLSVQVEDALKALGSLVEGLAREARKFIDSERESVISVKLLAINASTAEITHLREQNKLLTQLLLSENAKAEKAKDELIQRVSGLLGEFTAARDQSLRAAVSQVSDRNSEAEAGMVKFELEHGKVMDSMASTGDATQAIFERKGKEGKRTRDGALKVRMMSSFLLMRFIDHSEQHLIATKTSFKRDMSSLQDSMSASMSTHLTQTQEQSQVFSETCTTGM